MRRIEGKQFGFIKAQRWRRTFLPVEWSIEISLQKLFLMIPDHFLFVLTDELDSQLCLMLFSKYVYVCVNVVLNLRAKLMNITRFSFPFCLEL